LAKVSNLDGQVILPPPKVGKNKHISRKMAIKEKSWNSDEMAMQRDLELSKRSKFLVVTIEQQRRRRSRRRSRKNKRLIIRLVRSSPKVGTTFT
jgi:hypothetical protein